MLSRSLKTIVQNPTCSRHFFGKNISRIHGQKCCPYKQNGKPLSQQKVDEFLSQYRYTGEGVQWW